MSKGVEIMREWARSNTVVMNVGSRYMVWCEYFLNGNSKVQRVRLEMDLETGRVRSRFVTPEFAEEMPANWEVAT